ncbi:MAG: hypothetical protein KA469_00475 [Phycisphaerae bacterium]|nr:hypothetical protein [Phycisphaerae bacterium]
MYRSRFCLKWGRMRRRVFLWRYPFGKRTIRGGLTIPVRLGLLPGRSRFREVFQGQHPICLFLLRLGALHLEILSLLLLLLPPLLLLLLLLLLPVRLRLLPAEQTTGMQRPRPMTHQKGVTEQVLLCNQKRSYFCLQV